MTCDLCFVPAETVSYLLTQNPHPPLPRKQPTFTIIPVGLCLRWTQLLVLLTLCPPFPQPLMKFSSISSSIRWTSPLNRTKSTTREERNMADARCKRPIGSNVERRAVTRIKPFHIPSVQEYMSLRDAYLSVLHFSDTLTNYAVLTGKRLKQPTECPRQSTRVVCTYTV